MYPASSEGLNRETDKAVYFFTPAFYPLDNFSAHRFELWGHKFSTVEHAYHWKKFSSQQGLAEKILIAPSPEIVWRISRENKEKTPSGWLAERLGVMEEILRAKASQNEDVREALKKTGTRMIVENNPTDNFWGAGPSGKGENNVGKIWMKIRVDLV